MSDRPLSRASTARPGAPRTPATPSERDTFLSLALARLSLSRPSTPANGLGALRPASERDEGTDQDRGEGSAGATEAKTMQTLGTVTSPAQPRSSASGAGGPLFSLSGSETSPFTDGLMSRDEADEYAGSVVRSFLSENSSRVERTKHERLVFYQSLCVQFDLCDPEDVPSTQTQCCKMLEEVNICLREYLDVLDAGGDVRTEVKRYETRHDLRKYLWEGPMHEKYIPLNLAKAELLNPFLVNVRSRKSA
ncbi:hypothetical protein JCM10207_000461 [Rhodosporidiobolus poonsookiae]